MKFTEIIEFYGSLTHSHENLSDQIGTLAANKIREKSGIHNRFICADDENILEVANKAIQSEALKVKILDVNIVIVVSEYVENIIPPPSAIIFKDINFENKIVIDLNRGCSGFCEALVILNQFFESSNFIRGLIITAENYSKYIKKTNRSLLPIFTDAVTFTFLEKSKKSFFNFDGGSFYEFAEDLKFDIKNRDIYMNGAGLVSFVKSRVMPSARKLLSDLPRGINLDYLFTHQGSKLVVETISSGLNLNSETCPFTAKFIGNTNSSSIPISIKKVLSADESYENKTYNCLLSGFGVGLSYCNILLSLEFKK